MKKILFAALFVTGMVAASSCNALPIAPLNDASSDIVISVAGGCGPGWHRGPRGGCLRNYANPAAHACPRGFHVGPYGRCRANGS